MADDQDPRRPFRRARTHEPSRADRADQPPSLFDWDEDDHSVIRSPPPPSPTSPLGRASTFGNDGRDAHRWSTGGRRLSAGLESLRRGGPPSPDICLSPPRHRDLPYLNLRRRLPSVLSLLFLLKAVAQGPSDEGGFFSLGAGDIRRAQIYGFRGAQRAY
ncbi:hypothetical protein JCM11251_004522 [Rhodosporidiobolus azoricus]